MSYIVKCPQCDEVNIGSAFHCVKCNTNLIGIPREQGKSPLPDFVSPPPPLEIQTHQTKPLQPPASSNNTKTLVSKIFIITYVLTASLILIKSLVLQGESYIDIPGFTFIPFIMGLLSYWLPAEILLRFDRGTGHLISKLGLFETSGVEHASTHYTLSGLIFMIISIVINIVTLFAW